MENRSWLIQFVIFVFHIYVHMQKFKNNGLLAHESEVNKLQDEGDRLVEVVKHPGSPAIAVCPSIPSVHH